MVSINKFKFFYLILLVGGVTFQVFLKMLSEHCNHGAVIYKNIFIYGWFRCTNNREKIHIHWEINRWSDGEKEIDNFLFRFRFRLNSEIIKNTGQDGSCHQNHSVGQQTFNGILSHQMQHRFHAQNFPSRLLPGGILVGIKVRQVVPLYLGATPGIGWVEVILLIGTLQCTV